MDIARDKKGQRFGHGVIEQVKEAAEGADHPADSEADHRQPHMFDTRIGKQPLVVVLNQDE